MIKNLKPRRKKIKRRKKALKTFCVASAIVLAVLAAAAFMLTRTPAAYNPATPPENGQIPLYFTNRIAPEFFNKTQLDEPFTVLIEQAGFNEILADGSVFGWQWPARLNNITISAPAAVFEPDHILLMATVEYARFSLVLTAIAQPTIDELGRLTLNLEQVNAGFFDATFLLKKLTKGIIKRYLEQNRIPPETSQLNHISSAIIKNQPFDPVFPSYNDRDVRITAIAITKEKLLLTFKPQ